MAEPRILSLKHEGTALTLWTDAGVMKFECPPGLLPGVPAAAADPAPALLKRQCVKKVPPSAVPVCRSSRFFDKGVTNRGTPRKQAYFPRPGGAAAEKRARMVLCFEDFGNERRTPIPELLARYGFTPGQWANYTRGDSPLRQEYIAALTKRMGGGV